MRIETLLVDHESQESGDPAEARRADPVDGEVPPNNPEAAHQDRQKQADGGDPLGDHIRRNPAAARSPIHRVVVDELVHCRAEGSSPGQPGKGGKR